MHHWLIEPFIQATADFIIDFDSQHRMPLNASFFIFVLLCCKHLFYTFSGFFFGSISLGENLKYDSMLRISKHFLSYFLELTPIVNP